MIMDSKYYMMWLFQSLGLNIRKTWLLLNEFNSPENVWNAEERIIESVVKDTKTYRMLEKGKGLLPGWIEEVEKCGLRYISINESDYPKLLREIHEPPVGIYIKGNLPDFDEMPYISIIGARRCSEYGRNMAYKFSKELAKDGFTIVSGMAKGIDSLGHKGALDVGGATVAVLAFGHCHCYPSENRELMKVIGEKGCLLSEYPPDTPSNRFNFVQRNRIIAGISKGLFVVEAGRKSGTLTTVDFAGDSGRVIMALPSNITSLSGQGTNDLIKEGCPMITKVEDIYFELGISRKKKESKKEKNGGLILDKEEKMVYSILSYDAVGFDYIADKIKMEIPEIQYILTMLELKGAIQKLPGERYIRSL